MPSSRPGTASRSTSLIPGSPSRIPGSLQRTAGSNFSTRETMNQTQKIASLQGQLATQQRLAEEIIAGAGNYRAAPYGVSETTVIFGRLLAQQVLNLIDAGISAIAQ